jgi:Flp pilus assembly protein TadD
MHRWQIALKRALGSPALWLCVAAMAAGALVYAGALNNPFVYDDFRTVAENRSLERFPDLIPIVLHDAMRPLAGISWAIDRALWGPGPLGFHVSSLLLHLLNIALVFVLCRRAALDAGHGQPDRPDRSVATATVASAIFAVHPVLTQAVGYISARADLLCATGSLVTLLVFRQAVLSGRARWYVATLAAWVVAVGCKESAVMMPPLLLAYDALLLADRGTLRRRVWRFHVPVLAAMALVAVGRLSILWEFEEALRPEVHWSHMLVEADVVRRYVSLLFVATPQSVYHVAPLFTAVSDPRAIFALVWLLSVLIVAQRAAVRDRVIGFGVIWFFLMLVPPAALVVVNVGEPLAEHRVYLPAIGAFLAFAAVAGTAWTRLGAARRIPRAALAIGLVLLIVGLGERTIARNRIWSDPVQLWAEAADLAPDMWWPHQMLGEALEHRGRCADAVSEYRTAIAARPQEPQPYFRAGVCLTQLGYLADAASTFEQVRRFTPFSSRALLGLGTVAILDGRVADAQQYFQQAIEADPDNHELRASIARLAQTRTDTLRTLDPTFQH